MTTTTTTKTTTKAVRTTGCPGCSYTLAYPTTTFGVYTCKHCGGIYGECYLGDSYGYVLPYWASLEDCKRAEVDGTVKYFDFTTLGSQGISRRHGWYDTVTRCITQVG